MVAHKGSGCVVHVCTFAFMSRQFCMEQILCVWNIFAIDKKSLLSLILHFSLSLLFSVGPTWFQ